MEFKFDLTGVETEFLKKLHEKQHNGARDNLGKIDAIHVVEKNDRIFSGSDDGNVWVDGDNDYKEYGSFGALISERRRRGENLPEYESVLYETVNDIWITTAKEYCMAYGLNVYCGEYIDRWCPVAFFLIRDEAVRYKDGYQSHNCGGCRIYTYSMGYANHGDLPVFRDMLLRMGEQLSNETEEK